MGWWVLRSWQSLNYSEKLLITSLPHAQQFNPNPHYRRDQSQSHQHTLLNQPRILIQKRKPIPCLLLVLHTLQQTHDKIQNQKPKVLQLNKFILITKSVNSRVDLIICGSHCCSMCNSAHIKHSNKTHHMRHDHHTESLRFFSFHSYRDSPTYKRDMFRKSGHKLNRSKAINVK